MKKQFFLVLFLSLNLANLFGMEEERPEETLSAEEIKSKASQMQLKMQEEKKLKTSQMQLYQMRFEINSKLEQLQGSKHTLIDILRSKIKPNFKISKNLRIRTLLIFAEEIRFLCVPQEREQLELIGEIFRSYQKLIKAYHKEKTSFTENLPGFFQEYEESQNLLSSFIIETVKLKTPNSKIEITNLNIFRHALTDEIKQRMNTYIRIEMENRENLIKQREETLFLENFQKKFENDDTYYLE
ncbi:hypothetical protein K9L05_03400 [Candidatus Babeliales bacterium]|nr:hypothetical protein [Candidatus Babeliales bacterium]